MLWTKLFGDSDEAKPVWLKQIRDLDVKQILRNKQCRVFIKKYISQNRLDFGKLTLRPISKYWVGYWPTCEEELFIEIENFKANRLKKVVIAPREIPNFLNRFKNSLDIEVTQNRVKAIGRDPGYEITDKEYANALNEVFNRRMGEHARYMTRFNLGIMTLATVMSVVSDQPGYYWGILFMGGMNTWRQYITRNSKFE